MGKPERTETEEGEQALQEVQDYLTSIIRSTWPVYSKELIQLLQRGQPCSNLPKKERGRRERGERLHTGIPRAQRDVTLRISGTAKPKSLVPLLPSLTYSESSGVVPFPPPLPPNRRQFHGTGKREEQRAPTICHLPFGNSSALLPGNYYLPTYLHYGVLLLLHLHYYYYL